MTLKTILIKPALVTSLLWGSLLPLLFPLIITVGPNRITSTSPDGNITTSISNFSGYLALVEFYGVFGVAYLWLKSFLFVGVIVFIVCISSDLIKKLIKA